jgi:hypothetical protein
MQSRLARHVVILALVVAAVAASSLVHWSAEASGPSLPPAIGALLR